MADTTTDSGNTGDADSGADASGSGQSSDVVAVFELAVMSDGTISVSQESGDEQAGEDQAGTEGSPQDQADDQANGQTFQSAAAACSFVYKQISALGQGAGAEDEGMSEGYADEAGGSPSLPAKRSPASME